MDRVRRRHLLGLVGTGVLAGCLDEYGSGNGSSDPSGNGGDPPSSTGAWDGDLPPCPDYGDDVDRVVCYDGVDPADETAFLEPSTRSITMESSLECTLHNESDERLATNFYNWRVDKRVDGEWFRVAPLGYNQPLMYVEPGERHTWTVTPDNEGIADGERAGGSGGTEDVALEGVGPGAYAFRARGWFENGRSEERLAFATTFELEGEPLELTPTDAVEDVTLDDGRDVLVANSTRGDPDDEDHRLGAYELTVVDEPDGNGGESGDDEEGPRSTITEQVIRNEHLRDAIALAHEHDVSTVRLEEYDGTYPIFGYRSDGVYEYQGTYYRVRTRELEE